MSSFIWYQITGGEDAWHEALGEHREQIIRERRPAFVTVLDAHSSPESSWDRDEYARMKYSGPFYLDFDAETADITIPQFQKFLGNLGDIGVNLNSLSLYATGGRGFHIEIPAPVFMAKVPKTGVTALPYIYREMAMALVVDTLDLRVYTGRRGRMWRTPGIERSNGKFKVPISVADAQGMTAELYDELCSRPVPEPARELPELSTALAAMFIKAQTRMDEGLKRRSKGNADEALLAKFKGQFPPTIERILRGEGLAPGVGFQKLSMQLAITANALGKSADQLVEAAEGLCKNHQGDSSRYGSPRKRKEELRRMWEYTHDNPCYGYSRGAIRTLVDVDTPTSDLDGLTGGSAGAVGSVPEDDDEELTPELEAEVSSASSALLEGLMITNSGVHKRTADGAKTICNISFRKPMLLLDAEDLTVLGIEADLLSDGVPAGRHSVPGRAFTSRANLSAYCSSYGGIFSGSDTQAGAVSLMLTRSAKKGKRIVYALHKEGLDLIQNPLVKDRSVKDVVWVHPDKVVTENEEAQYVFQAAVSSLPIYNADVHNASALVANPDTLAWARSLLNMNSPTVMAQMLGWFVSCFHRQFYHHAYQQFPLLHPNGPAGSGKSMTTTLLARMFYLTSEVVVKSCAPSSTKTFALKAAMTGSASIPLLLDEYKPSEMGVLRTSELLQSFRLAYNQGTGSSGGMARGNASGSFRDITDYAYSTPLAFMSESQEMQTAMVQRSLPVSFSQHDSEAHREAYFATRAGQDNMAHLGRAILKFSFRETVESRRAALDPLLVSLRAASERSVHDRQVYNLAIVLEGINYLDNVLSTIFGDALKDDTERLKQALFDHKNDINVTAMSEAAKMMNDLALISRSEDSESEFGLREGREYIVREGCIELLMREIFVKYFSWCKRKGFTPYYSTAEAFIGAMGKFPPLMDKHCMTSPLKSSGQARVFRFSLEKLVAEGVEMFKTKA